jgi:hypothetical protein
LFNVESEVEQVSVTLALEDAEFPRYRIKLFKRGSETPLWQSQNLTPEKRKHGPALNITVPAERLKTGSYRLDVAGIGQDRTEPVGTYTFNVNHED